MAVSDGRARRFRTFAPREGRATPEMQDQAREHNASAHPTYGIRAHRKDARPVRFLEVRQAQSQPQPDQGAKRSIDPELYSHSRSPPPTEVS